MASRVSVVTVCRNMAATLERTIQSVLAQAGVPVEYIVIDGASTDSTAAILATYRDCLAVCISESDGGIAEAFNKGIAHTSGDYITFVNADDWLEPGQLARAAALLDCHADAAFVFGDVVYHRNGKAVFRRKGRADYRAGFGYQMGALNHPSLVCRRMLFDRVGPFDPSYRIAMDFEWLLRLHRSGYSGLYDSGICGHMEAGGISVAQGQNALRENRRAAVANGASPWRAWTYYAWAALKRRVRARLERWGMHRLVLWVRRHVFVSAVKPDAGDR